MQQNREYMNNLKKPCGDPGREMIEKMNEHHAPLIEWGLKIASLPEGGVILDVGCGGGVSCEMMAQRRKIKKVVALDHSATAIEETEKRCQSFIREGIVEAVVGDVMALPFAEETFDGAVSVESYYFWPDFVAGLREINRVLKEGAPFFLILETYGDAPCSEGMAEVMEQLDARNLPLAQLKDSFLQAGFDCVQVETLPGGWIVVKGNRNCFT